VPTPFYHLSLAEDLSGHPALSEAARTFLRSHRPAFLLGSTAPDVQNLTGQARISTHFFEFPLTSDDRPAWERILEEYPELAGAAGLPADQAAFLVGYLCHLQADWFWALEIFVPVFGPNQNWQSFRQRLYLHNVLRSFLDYEIMSRLPDDLGAAVRRADPSGWLPFVSDEVLCRWRDFLAAQLEPGAPIQTVEIFAARQGIPAEEYYRMISSEDQLNRMIFSRLPRETLHAFRQRLISEHLRLVETYLPH